MDHEVLLGGEMIGGAHECLLLKEMCHRVNNELASVIGIVSAALTRSRELETQRVLGNVMDRLHDHASLYSALQLPHERVSDASIYLRNVLVAISRARLANGGIGIIYREAKPIPCSAVQCWTLGMIVSELVTNSVRHAFGTRGGIVDVKLNQIGGLVECCVADNGSVCGPAEPGNGLRIVQSLVHSIGGSIRLNHGTAGTRAVLSFPCGMT
jgi:two-component sensor histidine kinase